jgi:hypothetical protein
MTLKDGEPALKSINYSVLGIDRVVSLAHFRLGMIIANLDLLYTMAEFHHVLQTNYSKDLARKRWTSTSIYTNPSRVIPAFHQWDPSKTPEIPREVNTPRRHTTQPGLGPKIPQHPPQPLRLLPPQTRLPIPPSSASFSSLLARNLHINNPQPP